MRKCKLVITNEGVFELFDGEALVLQADIRLCKGNADFEGKLQAIVTAAYQMGRRHEIGKGDA